MECLLSYSVNGWDLVIQGLINMSFSIFDTLSPKNTNGIREREGRREGLCSCKTSVTYGNGFYYIDSCFPEDSTE